MSETLLLKKLEANEMEFFALHRSSRKATNQYVALSSIVKTVPLWNFAGAIHAGPEQAESIVSEIEDLYRERLIAPAIRVTPWSEPRHLESVLAAKGYTPVLELSTMICQSFSKSAATDKNIQVKEVWTAEEVDLFTDLQILGFGGTLSEKGWYLETNLRNSQREDHKYFVGFLDGHPAGVCLTLNHPDDVLGIYGVATLEAYRGRGVARVLLERVITDAISSGVINITLATAQDGLAEKAFSRLGFRRAFASKIYQLKSTGGRR